MRERDDSHRPSIRVSAAVLLLTAATVASGITPPAAEPAAAAASALPTAEATTPAVASPDVGRTDIFTRSAAGHLLQRYRLEGGSWRRALDRGGSIRSQPAVVSPGPGRLEVFARGTDNQLWHRAFAGGTWSAWEQLGGSLTSAPTVASWSPDRLDVFARGTDGALYRIGFANGTWSNWNRLGGILTSSPAATSWGPGRIDVVSRGSGNVLQHISYTSGIGWSPWKLLDARLTAQPAIASPASGQLDVVLRDKDGLLAVKRFDSSQGWAARTTLGPSLFASGPSITVAGGLNTIVARHSNGASYEKVRSGATGSWSGWRRIDQYQPFRGLATWVDVLDYPALEPATAIADMEARGVRTLFLSTARFNSAQDFYDEVEMGRWLDRAHAAGIRVVGWYVPAYGDMTRDVRRAAAVGSYLSPGGQRFDAVGIDIERFGPSGEVNRSTFNARVVPHLRQVRARTTAVIAAIVPSPYATQPGNNWAGFPWSGVGSQSEVAVPMALWSFRSGFSVSEVRRWVRSQIDRTQALTGRPVHVEGGVDGEGSITVTGAYMDGFADAARAAGAIGGSNYDYRTTKAKYWPMLQPLNG